MWRFNKSISCYLFRWCNLIINPPIRNRYLEHVAECSIFYFLGNHKEEAKKKKDWKQTVVLQISTYALLLTIMKNFLWTFKLWNCITCFVGLWFSCGRNCTLQAARCIMCRRQNHSALVVYRPQSGAPECCGRVASVDLLLFLHRMPYEYACVKTPAQFTVWTYEGWNFNSGNYLFTTDTK